MYSVHAVLYVCYATASTRNQAVARIADRSASQLTADYLLLLNSMHLQVSSPHL